MSKYVITKAPGLFTPWCVQELNDKGFVTRNLSWSESRKDARRVKRALEAVDNVAITKKELSDVRKKLYENITSEPSRLDATERTQGGVHAPERRAGRVCRSWLREAIRERRRSTPSPQEAGDHQRQFEFYDFVRPEPTHREAGAQSDASSNGRRSWRLGQRRPLLTVGESFAFSPSTFNINYRAIDHEWQFIEGLPNDHVHTPRRQPCPRGQRL